MANNKLSELLTDEAILTEFGQRLAARRIELQLTQAEAAAQAGVGKRTLERIEAGESAQTASLVRLLRVLNALGGLDQLLPPAGVGPMALLQHKEKTRRRASKRRSGGQWTWGDESQ